MFFQSQLSTLSSKRCCTLYRSILLEAGFFKDLNELEFRSDALFVDEMRSFITTAGGYAKKGTFDISSFYYYLDDSQLGHFINAGGNCASQNISLNDNDYDRIFGRTLKTYYKVIDGLLKYVPSSERKEKVMIYLTGGFSFVQSIRDILYEHYKESVHFVTRSGKPSSAVLLGRAILARKLLLELDHYQYHF